MSNRLKDIFSNKMPDMVGKIQFRNKEAVKQFDEAVSKVYKEGCTVLVDGITTIVTKIKEGNNEYPLMEKENPLAVSIGPSKEKVRIDVNVDGVKREMEFYHYQTDKTFVLENNEKSIIYFKIESLKENNTMNLYYNVQSKHATSVNEILESFKFAEVFLDKIFSQDESNNFNGEIETVEGIRNFFRNGRQFFEWAEAVENELDIKLRTEDLNDPGEIEKDIGELYFALIENKVIKLNICFISDATIMIREKDCLTPLKVGEKLDTTFLNSIEYSFGEQRIKLYTANLLSNAIIKEIKKEDEKIKIVYGDTDSAPMYISRTLFKTEEEAKKELGRIIDHKDDYVNAKTVYDYLSSRN